MSNWSGLAKGLLKGTGEGLQDVGKSMITRERDVAEDMRQRSLEELRNQNNVSLATTQNQWKIDAETRANTRQDTLLKAQNEREDTKTAAAAKADRVKSINSAIDSLLIAKNNSVNKVYKSDSDFLSTIGVDENSPEGQKIASEFNSKQSSGRGGFTPDTSFLDERIAELRAELAALNGGKQPQQPVKGNVPKSEMEELMYRHSSDQGMLTEGDTADKPKKGMLTEGAPSLEEAQAEIDKMSGEQARKAAAVLKEKFGLDVKAPVDPSGVDKGTGLPQKIGGKAVSEEDYAAAVNETGKAIVNGVATGAKQINEALNQVFGRPVEWVVSAGKQFGLDFVRFFKWLGDKSYGDERTALKAYMAANKDQKEAVEGVLSSAPKN